MSLSDLARAESLAQSKDIMMKHFEEFKQALTKTMAELSFSSGKALITEHVHALVDYCVTGGKMFRGSLVVHSCRSFLLHHGVEFTPQTEYTAALLGWTLETLQAAYLIADDIMDGATTRRSKPCWHLVAAGSQTAINDTFLAIFGALRLARHLARVFSAADALPLDLPAYYEEVTLRTALGQHIDTTTVVRGAAEAQRALATPGRVREIAVNKTSHYTVVQPLLVGFALGAALVGGPDARYISGDGRASLEAAGVALGIFFQMQDDFLDIFAPPDVLGKDGTDVAEGKAAWPLMAALFPRDSKRAASPGTLRALEEHYGTPSGKPAVRAALERAGVPQRYRTEAAERVDECQRLIAQLPPAFRAAPSALLARIVGRKF